MSFKDIKKNTWLHEKVVFFLRPRNTMGGHVQPLHSSEEPLEARRIQLPSPLEGTRHPPYLQLEGLGVRGGGGSRIEPPWIWAGRLHLILECILQ